MGKKKLASEIAELYSINMEYLSRNDLFIIEENITLLKFTKKARKKLSYSKLENIYLEQKKINDSLNSFINQLKLFNKKTLEKFDEYLVAYRTGLIKGDFIIFVQSSFSIIEGYMNIVLNYDALRHDPIPFAKRWTDFMKINESSLFNQANQRKFQYNKIKEYYRDPRNPIDHGSLVYLKDKVIIKNILTVLYDLLIKDIEALKGYPQELPLKQSQR